MKNKMHAIIINVSPNINNVPINPKYGIKHNIPERNRMTDNIAGCSL